MVIENTKYGYLCTKTMSGSPTKILIEMATDLSVTGITSFDISPINRTVKSPQEFELEHYEFTGEEVERIEYPDPEPAPEETQEPVADEQQPTAGETQPETAGE